MAALQEFDLSALNAPSDLSAATADPRGDTAIRAAVAAAAWAWFHANGDVRIKARLGPFRPSMRLRALGQVWTMIFGPDPMAPIGGAP